MAATRNTDIVICGAGIAGVATAYHMAISSAGQRITLVDECQPLSYTTSSSGENFRDCWPNPQMADLMRDSIARMEQLAKEGNRTAAWMGGAVYSFAPFHLVYARANPDLAQTAPIPLTVLLFMVALTRGRLLAAVIARGRCLFGQSGRFLIGLGVRIFG